MDPLCRYWMTSSATGDCFRPWQVRWHDAHMGLMGFQQAHADVLTGATSKQMRPPTNIQQAARRIHRALSQVARCERCRPSLPVTRARHDPLIASVLQVQDEICVSALSYSKTPIQGDLAAVWALVYHLSTHWQPVDTPAAVQRVPISSLPNKSTSGLRVEADSQGIAVRPLYCSTTHWPVQPLAYSPRAAHTVQQDQGARLLWHMVLWHTCSSGLQKWLRSLGIVTPSDASIEAACQDGLLLAALVKVGVGDTKSHKILTSHLLHH